MKTLKTAFAVALLVVAGAAGASHKHNGHKQYGDSPRDDLFEYAKVVEVQPIYREVQVSRPVRECREEPVYHTGNGHPKSAGGMLAGGLIGGPTTGSFCAPQRQQRLTAPSSSSPQLSQWTVMILVGRFGEYDRDRASMASDG